MTIVTEAADWVDDRGNRITGRADRIGTGVWIRSDDAHPICDAANGQRLNPSRPVTIGDRVWLADEAMVLAGATIGEWAVIGMRALVKGTIPPACAAAGVPARVIRSNIRWDRTQLRQLPAPERAPA